MVDILVERHMVGCDNKQCGSPRPGDQETRLFRVLVQDGTCDKALEKTLLCPQGCLYLPL